MEPSDYLLSLRVDGAALASVVDGNLDLEVPSCPGWSVADLVWHVTEVHAFWSQIAGRLLQDPGEAEHDERPDDADLLATYAAGVVDLVATLEAADLDARVWSWISPDPVPTSWILRRMTQETAVHRWDAQDAVGEAEPIAPAIAVDGIDEFLFQFAGFDPIRLANGGETVEFDAVDTGHAWVARVARGELDVRPADRAASLVPVEGTATGTASDLLLLLWRRLRLDAVQVSGDRAALARFLVRAGLD